jgi:UDP-N-acetylglucosamine--N-acetylmuramyl-(pentapeptide) pyrophosphoryl-undecaprenol N-acetylglucosamine transferase
VLVGFPHAFDEPIDSRVARWLPKPSTVDVCGTPLRAEMLTQPEPAARFAGRSGPLRLLVVGGSLGAQAVNDLIVAALQRVHPSARPQVVHQAGDKNHAAVQARYAEAQIEADVRAFIGDMASAYAACDLLICRAGAITVAEVAAIGVAPLLIPLPWFVGDEQRANARFLADAGAGRILDQQSTTPEALAALLTQLTRETLLAWAEAAHRLGKRDATERAAAACASLVVA